MESPTTTTTIPLLLLLGSYLEALALLTLPNPTIEKRLFPCLLNHHFTLLHFFLSLTLSNPSINMKMVLALVFMVASLGGKWAEAQLVDHVVGGDRGWHPSSDVASWSSGRSFRVGDKIWFAYSAAEDSIIELKSKNEYESCDVTNPIRMYTDGLNSITLLEEGVRYFVSTNPENCKNGLKLHVEVMPSDNLDNETKVAAYKNSVSAMAAAPTSPSGSTQLYGNFGLFLLGLGLCFMSTQF